MTDIQGQVLYENRALDSDAVVTYSGTPVSGFDFQYSYDWRDFTLFAVDDSETNVNLDIELPSGGTIDNVGLFVKPYTGSSDATIELFYESAPAVFTSIDSWTINENGLLIQEDISSTVIAAGRKLRWQITTDDEQLFIRNLAAGERLDFPIGQRDGLKPPTLNGDIVVNNKIAENGSIIGRSIRRIDRLSTIMLEYLSESFVRNEWEVFTLEANIHAFYYRWDKVFHGTEATFAIAESVPRPENMMPPPLMSASLPLRNLVVVN